MLVHLTEMKIYPESNILNEDQIKKVHLRHEEMNINKRSIFSNKTL